MSSQQEPLLHKLYNAVADRLGKDIPSGKEGVVCRRLSEQDSRGIFDRPGPDLVSHIHYRPSCDAAATVRLWQSLEPFDCARAIAALKDGGDPHSCLGNGASQAFMTTFMDYAKGRRGDDLIGDIKTTLSLAVKNGFDFNVINKENEPLLHGELLQRHPELLAHCLELGADPNVRDKRNQTPLFDGSSPERIFILLDHNAELTLRSDFNTLAMIHWHPGQVKRFIEYGIAHDRLSDVIRIRDLALAENEKAANTYMYKVWWEGFDPAPYLRGQARPKESAVSRYLEAQSERKSERGI